MGKAVQGVIITPLLINSVQIFRACFIICPEADIALGSQKINDVVSVRNRIVQIVQSRLAQEEARS